MIEYRCVKIEFDVEDTEKMLNRYAKQGWKLICSYAWHNHYLILERRTK